MTTDDRITAARRQLAEAEASLLQSLAAVRASLTVVEEENRALRRESLERETVYYTEREFAEMLKVSESTVERLRLSGKLKFVRVGIQVRYASAHLGQFEEERPANESGARRGPTRLPISRAV